ncbi:MAG: hypothetical protein ACLUVC_13345 [Longibaculum sp.]
MKIPKLYLLFIAGIVWSIAGLNILKIGIDAYVSYVSLFHLLLSLIVYGVFMKFIFSKMVYKHTLRIISYEEERQLFIKFFDIQAFCIMAFMMSGGISLRVFHLVPDVFIAVFYSGLGGALFCAGILFFVSFYQNIKEEV